MIIAVTSIRLRRLRDYFRLLPHSFRITLQARKQPGFLRMRNTGWGRLHYTLTAWKTEADMRAFSRSGAHKTALPAGPGLSTEIRTYVYEGDSLPAWKEAKRLLAEKGKVLAYGPRAPGAQGG